MFDKTEPIEEKLNDDEHNWRKDNHTNRFKLLSLLRINCFTVLLFSYFTN